MSKDSINSSGRLHGIWALTNRELKKWYKEPIIFMLSIVQPVIWMGLFGKAMNIGALLSGNPSIPPDLAQQFMLQTFGTSDYFSYMSVGIVAFVALFTTMFSGMSVVWDRRLGFLNKVLSTPVSRAVIVFSKVLSAALRSMFQAAIVIGIAFLFGLQVGPSFNWLNLLGVLAIVFLICVGLSSFFIAITIRSTRMETPMAVANLITLPLMFASNAFFPSQLQPDWLQTVARFNPMSYTTDAVRQLLIFNMDVGQLLTDFLYVGIFAFAVAAIGIVLSWRYLSR
jgi:ABC-2 type transport system permease protein